MVDAARQAANCASDAADPWFVPETQAMRTIARDRGGNPQADTEHDWLRIDAICAQRELLATLRRQGKISDDAFHRLEEEVSLGRAARITARRAGVAGCVERTIRVPIVLLADGRRISRRLSASAGVHPDLRPALRKRHGLARALKWLERSGARAGRGATKNGSFS